jgi:hypothetical protein
MLRTRVYLRDLHLKFQNCQQGYDEYYTEKGTHLLHIGNILWIQHLNIISYLIYQDTSEMPVNSYQIRVLYPRRLYSSNSVVI